MKENNLKSVSEISANFNASFSGFDLNLIREDDGYSAHFSGYYSLSEIEFLRADLIEANKYFRKSVLIPYIEGDKNSETLDNRFDTRIVRENDIGFFGSFSSYTVLFLEADSEADYSSSLSIFDNGEGVDSPVYFEFSEITTLIKANEVYNDLLETGDLAEIVKKYNGSLLEN